MTSGPPLALLASPVRRDILRVLSSLPLTPTPAAPRTRREGLTASELGERLNLHVTTIRFHVDQMLAAGLLVARDVPIGVGRPRRFYSAHPGHASVSEPDAYRIVADILADACAAASPAGPLAAVETAARVWATRHAAAALSHGVPLGHGASERLDLLVDLLGRWGFAPRLSQADPSPTIELTAFPAPDLAERHPALAASIERGLVGGVLAVLDADLRLEVGALDRPGTAIIRRPGPGAGAAG
nr:helix-turn-helix domain-containing protein [Propionibacterium sp.]